MDGAEFTRRVRELLPANLLSERGAVLYSTADTLKPGNLYILGLNPGGTDGDTIEERLEALPLRTKNEYLDEVWGRGHYGEHKKCEHPLQRRLRWLVEELDEDLRQTCASNLIFTRSRSEKGLAINELARLCWGVHELILNIVKPKMILAFGNGERRSPYSFLRSKFKPSEEEVLCDIGHGNWKCKAFKATLNRRTLYVVGLPHLSRYDVIGKSQVVEWVNARLKSMRHSPA